MNVESGTETAQFPEKEYTNGIFVAVPPYISTLPFSPSSLPFPLPLPCLISFSLLPSLPFLSSLYLRATSFSPLPTLHIFLSPCTCSDEYAAKRLRRHCLDFILLEEYVPARNGIKREMSLERDGENGIQSALTKQCSLYILIFLRIEKNAQTATPPYLCFTFFSSI